MRKLAIAFTMGVFVLSANMCFAVTTATIDIKAMIDGKDWLIIDLSGDTLQWLHLKPFAAVGRHKGLNEPTVISTTLNSITQLDQENWIPDWPEPPPEEFRHREVSSSFFTGLFPGIPITDMVITKVTVDSLYKRGTVSLIELTEDSAIIEFNDNPPQSHYWYEAQIIIEMVPEPATMSLFGLGGLALLRKRRR